MNRNLLEQFQEKEKGPFNWLDFKVGDTVKIFQKVKEIASTAKRLSKTAKKALEAKGENAKSGVVERIQIFEGIVIIKKHGKGLNGTFTVRKISEKVGVEKIFPFHSPHIEKIEIIKRAKTRRAKLYYLRSIKGKKARKKMKERKFEKLLMEEPEIQKEPQDQPTEQTIAEKEPVTEKTT